MFGANKQKNPSEGCPDNNLSLNLDRDMLEGLKSLFQAHRDYLYYLVKEMGIDTSDEKGLYFFISYLEHRNHDRSWTFFGHIHDEMSPNEVWDELFCSNYMGLKIKLCRYGEAEVLQLSSKI